MRPDVRVPGMATIVALLMRQNAIPFGWGDWGLGREGGCSFRDVGTWSVLSGHKHREGAAMKYFAGLDVSLEETAICVVDETGGS